MKNLLLLLPVIIMLSLACKKQEDIRGVFVNKNSERIEINCNYQISSTQLSEQSMMPKNGDKIKLNAQDVKQEKITLSFMWEDMSAQFAVWDPYKDEILVGGEVYNRKSFLSCD